MRCTTTTPHQLRAEIGLILSEKSGGYSAGSLIKLRADEFIAYGTAEGCTRIRLTGRRDIMVRESTEQIDRLLRQAQTSFTDPQLFIATKEANADRLGLLGQTKQQKAA